MLSFPSATAFLFSVSSKETEDHMESVAENKLNRFTKGWYLRIIWNTSFKFLVANLNTILSHNVWWKVFYYSR